MPRYLRKDAIRLLETGQDALYLACMGLGMPPRRRTRTLGAANAIEIGLIGVASELAMSACLVQTGGQTALLRSNGHFKTGGEILADFRKLLDSPSPSASFLTAGVAEAAAHRGRIRSSTARFNTIIAARAGGLHAGRGPTREAALALAHDVADFYDLLAASDRMRPYLVDVPRPPPPLRDRVAIINDLAGRIDAAKTVEHQGRLIASVYLILPWAEESPAWLGAFERAVVAPTTNDVSLLLAALATAEPATLRRVSKSVGSTISVVVRPDDPLALPISPQFLRTEFTKMPDQWQADIANANGRLRQGVLDLPPDDFVNEVFALSFETTGILGSSDFLTAHQAWPFVAASLNRQGTPGPYWFVVRRVAESERTQLGSLLSRAAGFGTKILRDRVGEAEAGIKALDGGHSPVPRSLAQLAKNLAIVESEREQRLRSALSRSRPTRRALPVEFEEELLRVAEDGQPGELLRTLIERDAAEPWLGYWTRVLCENATSREDVPALLAVARNDKLTGPMTAARKAIRSIDFCTFGPASDS